MGAVEEFLDLYFNPDGSPEPTLGNGELNLDRIQAINDLMWEIERDEEEARRKSSHWRFVG